MIDNPSIELMLTSTKVIINYKNDYKYHNRENKNNKKVMVIIIIKIISFDDTYRRRKRFADIS